MIQNALRAVAVDMSLLRRRRDLRLMTIGYTVSLLGGEFTQVALAVQVYALTHSTLAVGLLGAAEFIPIVTLALVGGALADAFDRRRLIWGAELAAAFVSAALLVNALLPHPQVWVLYVAAALFAGATAVLRPPLDALLPRLVERDELKAASALNWSLAKPPSIKGIVESLRYPRSRQELPGI
jgi:MFS family permease